MAKIKKLPSGSWNTRVYIGDKTYSVTAPTKAECEYKAAQIRTGAKKADTKKTVRDCVVEYIELSRPVLKAKTIEGYDVILRHAFPHLMDTPVDELDDKLMQNAINLEAKRINSKGKLVTPKTIRNEYGCISAALKLVANKTFIVRLPSQERTISHLPEPEEIMRAFKGTEIELPVMLAMWCGLRASEIQGLTFGSIKGDYLLIDRTIVELGTERVVQNSTKTDSSVREVFIPDYVKGLFPPLTDDLSAPLINLSHHQIFRRYRTICKHNGLDITFHRLRHMFASISLTRLMLPPKEVQTAGGWKTDYVMNKIYSETFSETRKEADKKRCAYLNELIKTETKTETKAEKH